jgi:hypothetical protein
VTALIFHSLAGHTFVPAFVTFVVKLFASSSLADD